MVMGSFGLKEKNLVLKSSILAVKKIIWTIRIKNKLLSVIDNLLVGGNRIVFNPNRLKHFWTIEIERFRE